MIGIIIICAIFAGLVNSSLTGIEYLIIINVITFIFYGWDKLAAYNDWWRVMELTLHLLSLMGGWPLAFIAQQLFRHKIRKPDFQFFYWFIVIIHMIFIYFLYYQNNN
jgi:uncharacterized membrane protein YsdA (DUF1294 family)